MTLQIRIKRKNFAIKTYYVLMALLMIARYILRINISSVAFLLVAVVPVFFGSTSELLACVMTYIPLSPAFQYKYALLIAMSVMLLRSRWRLRSGIVFILIILMMVWEALHIGYGYFSIKEYFRGFAELLFLGALIMIDIGEIDYQLIIRSLVLFVVGVCGIMLFMQLKQSNFSLLAIVSRSAANWRFGQSNMTSGAFALNFNANNLGFICNLSICSVLLLRKRNEHTKMDMVFAVCSVIFALMTLSRAAIVCMAMIVMLYVIGDKEKTKRWIRELIVVALVGIIAIALIYRFLPTVFDNILERFQRKDVWNGRGSLMTQYMRFVFMEPKNLLFGIGMQGIYEKVSPIVWVHDVPHNGLQEVLVAWGIPGVLAVLSCLMLICVLSRVCSQGKRSFYQFMPFLLTLVFTMSGQLLTSPRALLSLSFAYICACIASDESQKGVKEI